MAFSQVIPPGNRSGQGTTPGLAVPAGAGAVALRILSDNWVTSADVMQFILDRSDDNGANWRESSRGSVQEGALNRDGSKYQKRLTLDQATAQTQIRARYDITGTMRFGLEVEWYDASGTPMDIQP